MGEYGGNFCQANTVLTDLDIEQLRGRITVRHSSLFIITGIIDQQSAGHLRTGK
ncbi:hypothetical protein PISMIDRAFT_682577, partial [Pisolithus microcarpus 441]